MIKIKRVIAQILGGRPMYFDRHAFFDHIGCEDVNVFTDRLGRRWLANHRWSLFRVPKT